MLTFPLCLSEKKVSVVKRTGRLVLLLAHLRLQALQASARFRWSQRRQHTSTVVMSVDQHILCSTGAPKQGEKEFDTFSTSYEIGHGRTDFNVRSPPKQRTTGYSSNFRPGVYYRPELDEKDNPALGVIIREAVSRSHTRYHFQHPPPDNDGHRPLPGLRRTVEGERNESGYGKQGAPSTLPRHSEVRQHYAAERLHQQGPIAPAQSTYLKTLAVKRDPVQSENERHGPAYMSTEAATKFRGVGNSRDLHTDSKSLGKKTATGWTNDQAVADPITCRPGDPYSAATEKNNNQTRPVGRSMTHADFQPSRWRDGTETMPAMQLAGSDHNTAFTRESDTRSSFQHRRSRSAYEPIETLPNVITARMKKSDPAALMNSHFPDNHSSVTKNCFEDLPHLAKSEPPVAFPPVIGNREKTGYSSNNIRYLAPGNERSSFYTSHYLQRFNDKNPAGNAREGFVGGNANPQLPSGFLRSTRVHEQDQGSYKEGVSHLTTVHPYVARSIMKRDPFFHDTTHAHKIRT